MKKYIFNPDFALQLIPRRKSHVWKSAMQNVGNPWFLQKPAVRVDGIAMFEVVVCIVLFVGTIGFGISYMKKATAGYVLNAGKAMSTGMAYEEDQDGCSFYGTGGTGGFYYSNQCFTSSNCNYFCNSSYHRMFNGLQGCLDCATGCQTSSC